MRQDDAIDPIGIEAVRLERDQRGRTAMLSRLYGAVLLLPVSPSDST